MYLPHFVPFPTASSLTLKIYLVHDATRVRCLSLCSSFPSSPWRHRLWQQAKLRRKQFFRVWRKQSVTSGTISRICINIAATQQRWLNVPTAATTTARPYIQIQSVLMPASWLIPPVATEITVTVRLHNSLSYSFTSMDLMLKHQFPVLWDTTQTTVIIPDVLNPTDSEVIESICHSRLAEPFMIQNYNYNDRHRMYFGSSAGVFRMWIP